jgi:hypothetical protein
MLDLLVNEEFRPWSSQPSLQSKALHATSSTDKLFPRGTSQQVVKEKNDSQRSFEWTDPNDELRKLSSLVPRGTRDLGADGWSIASKEKQTPVNKW